MAAETVASPSKAIEKMRPSWELCEALLEGTEEMREAAQAYLPRWPAEEIESYKARLRVAVLFPAFARTVQTLAGKPFSKPLTLSDDMPEDVRAWCEDIDREGRNLHSFAAELMTHALAYGCGGILCDYPDASEVPASRADGVRTVQDERRAGLRPYMVHIKAEQILGWRLEGGRLAMLRIMECADEPDGQWGTRHVDQVRVLTPGAWQVWRIPEGKTDWKDATVWREGTTTLDFVPFVPYYGKREGYMLGRPPLLELAHLNVAHWQSASDQQNILHVARVPILAAKGVGEGFKLTVGAQSAVNLGDNPTAELRWVEHSGAAIAAGRTDLQDLEERMRQAGAELLVIKPGQVTATQTAAENAVGMCALQRITLDLQDALNLALSYLGAWVRMTPVGTVKLFNDFGVATLAEASAQMLLDANIAGKLSDQTLRDEYRRRGILSADVTEADEVARLEAQGPALGGIGGPNGGAGAA